MIYQTDFIAGLVAALSLQFVNLLFIFVIFEKVPDLQGWKRDEVVFVYGLSIAAYGLFHAFFANIYYLGGYYIVEGNLDRVLLRPLHPLFQIYAERIDLEDFGETFLGFGLVVYAVIRLGLDLSIIQWLALPLFVVCGVLVFLGVFTALASATFWIMDRIGLIPPFYNMMAFGRYPVTIYHPVLRFVLSWVVPFAFVGFFPSTWFLGRPEFWTYFLLTPVVALVTFGMGCVIFQRGMRRYESAGS